MKLVLPLLIALLGLAGGLSAGHYLRPDAAPAGGGAEAAASEASAPAEATPTPRPETLPGAAPPRYDPDEKRDYVAIDRQFLVPLVEDGEVAAMMILSLTLEMEIGARDAVFEREPKLRDRFLHVMFRHAQSGAFAGVFTAGPAMRDLRGALLEAARGVLGPAVHDVLVTDLLRQDL
ncbi:MAG TPA: flagellar basal body-associated FliL family protein [Paracoccaceae bacterium]|nr:flagellar basal body-associated FliL family protein [Paracoccaceae bacterium]